MITEIPNFGYENRPWLYDIEIMLKKMSPAAIIKLKRFFDIAMWFKKPWLRKKVLMLLVGFYPWPELNERG